MFSCPEKISILLRRQLLVTVIIMIIFSTKEKSKIEKIYETMVYFRGFVTYEPYLACTFFPNGSCAKVCGKTISTVGCAQGTRSLCTCLS